MTTLVRSIDAAAAGYIRHKFVRALSASFVVAAVFGIAALTVIGTIGVAIQGDITEKALVPVTAALVFLIYVTGIMLAVGLAGAIIDSIHRRLIALVLFLAALGIFLFLLAGIAAAVAYISGWYVDDSAEPMTTRDALWMGLFSVAGALISYEILRQAWWQLTVGAADFRAVRGWRPSPWRLLTTFRRHLGLPSFLSYVGRKRAVATLLYFGVAVLNVGVAMLLVLPPVIGALQELGEGAGVYIAIAAMGVLLLLNLLGVGALFARIADARATKLYQNVRDWDTRPPIVFLRAFDQDAARLHARSGDAFARWPAGVGRPRTLDEILLEHGSPYGPVIAIGDPRDPTPPLGAARVFVEGAGEEWQDVVRALAGASCAVVMCPNHGEGVQWELDLIGQAGGRLHTIFLASPELDRQATLALFERIIPSMPEIRFKQWPIAAYARDGAWHVMTAKRLSVESYTAALNAALQALFGLKGVDVPKRLASAPQQHGAPVDRLHVAGA
jgi:hypothetical protein